MRFEQQLKLLISSRHLFIYILTNEEERLEHVISRLVCQEFDSNIYSWDFIDGYTNNPNYLGYAQRNPLAALEFIETLDFSSTKVFILKDFHLFMNDISIIRKIKNLSTKLKNINFNIIIVSSEINIPILLKDRISLIEFPKPNIGEINSELKRLFSVLNIKYKLDLDNLAFACRGMSMDFIRKLIAKLVFTQQSPSYIFHLITEEKKQFIKQTDILHFCSVSNTLQDIGGLFCLKQWLQKRSNAFSKQAQSYGLPIPKGLLLVGIQGTGKSLSAKVIAQHWKLPLLRLDVGKIFGGVVGESEKNIRKVIKLSEDLSPCVLWIDEIDKAFNRFTNNSDSGTSNRVLSTLLTWLSEKTKQVFVVATANDVLSLPSEMLRKGRFDEIFFLNLPNLQEREMIFQIHLMKVRPLTWKQYNINHLSKLTNSFSGSEIQQSIIEAMNNAFYEKRDFNNNDIINAISDIIPLAFTDHAKIESMQEWAKLGKVRLAS
uniref:hypothetical protein n=1 Tax=Hypnea pseudomusciformis TaxID=1545697 RepID=UPI0027DA26CF|nr:hypothetical protein P4C74_pgp169 [Hypnea pseudomusciformis]WCH55064.1 hypothetical protein [Hypnea pseudomusciformis]WCH56657.1 hypothetical protein [Hypnea pseudomusciformis]